MTEVLDGVLHPEWTWKKPSDPDMAVLLLKDFLPNKLAVLNLDASIPDASQDSYFAMGFGLINDSTSSRNLLGASVPYMDDCSPYSTTYNKTRHLCADAREIATCGGDSGSPIMLNRLSNVQVGINSYSNGRCTSQTLDVYTRITFYKDWIEEQVCNLSSDPPPYCGETTTPTTVPTVKETQPPTTTPTVMPSQVPSLAATTTLVPTTGSSMEVTDISAVEGTEMPSEEVQALAFMWPTPFPTTGLPSVLPTTNEPTSSPTTGSPTVVPTTDEPTLSPATTSPTVAPITNTPSRPIRITETPTVLDRKGGSSGKQEKSNTGKWYSNFAYPTGHGGQ